MPIYTASRSLKIQKEAVCFGKSKSLNLEGLSTKQNRELWDI